MSPGRRGCVAPDGTELDGTEVGDRKALWLCPLLLRVPLMAEFRFKALYGGPEPTNGVPPPAPACTTGRLGAYATSGGGASRQCLRVLLLRASG